MFPSQKRLPQEESALLGHFRQLDTEGRSSLMAFAEFLASRNPSPPLAKVQEPLQPQLIDRPAQESVIGALKRLSRSYPMLERDKMLNETSLLMSAHLLQGRAASEVIDDLEALFHQHYQHYVQQGQ